MPPRGLTGRTFPSLEQKLETLSYLLDHLELVVLYHQQKLYAEAEVVSYSMPRTKAERNAAIIRQYEDGVSLTTLAGQYRLSVQRIHQIVQVSKSS